MCEILECSPYRKALHIESKPEDKEELKELFQYANKQNLVSLRLGKQAHITKVMTKESTPGEIKRMVKYAMGHANYQGSMTSELIVGISLLDGGESPTTLPNFLSCSVLMVMWSV